MSNAAPSLREHAGNVVRAAARQGLAVHGPARYRHAEATTAPVDALVVGYGTPPDHAWAGALDALCEALAQAACAG